MRKIKASRVLLPILAALAIVIVLSVNCTVSSSAAPHAGSGVLDLSSWSGGANRAFQLTGQWEFYWDRLLNDTQIKSGKEKFDFVNTFDGWNYDAGSGLPAVGKATYRLHVTGAVPGTEYGVYIQNEASVYRLYIDDKLIAGNGSLGDSAEAPMSEYSPQLASFAPDSESFDVILQISNNAYAVGGMWKPVMFGTYQEVSFIYNMISFTGNFFTGGLIVISLFFLIFFTAEKRSKEVLALAGIGAMLVIYLLVRGNMPATYLFTSAPISDFMWIEYLSAMWMVFSLLYFAYTSYIMLVPKWQIIALLVFSAGVSLFVALFPFSTVVSAYMVLNYIWLFIIIVVAVHFARAAYKGLDGAPALFGAVMIIFSILCYGEFVSDSSIAFFFISNGAFEYMLLFFVQCFIIARRYRNTQKMEFALLKDQIHPHFIHNALATIISVSRKDTERSRELLMDFSSYLRGFYDYEGNELIPLDKELEFIKAYVALEQARFGDKLRAEYQIEAADVVIPPLILQPLVENAFVHGLREKEAGGTALVYAVKLKNDKIRIGVRDDGVGMGSAEKASERQGIGIININRRLERLYRTQLVFTIPEGGGCEVYLEIPPSKTRRKEAAYAQSGNH
jgi:two-component system, LytTR family, sensor kinase